MSAFLAFVGGAAGEWNKMDEEKRAAAAEKAKREREAVLAEEQREADFAWWKKEQEYTADQEEKKAEEARTREQEEREERYNQLAEEVVALNEAVPNMFHRVTVSTESGMPTIESLDVPKTGYTFADALNKAREQNAYLQQFGVYYVPEPLADNPEQYTLASKKLSDDEDVNLFSNQADAQAAADVENNRLADTGITNLMTVVVPTSDGKNWTYKTEKISDTPKSEGPAVDPNTDLELHGGGTYYFMRSAKFGPKVGETAQKLGAQIIPLRSELPLAGEGMMDMVENQDYVLIRRPMGVEGDADRAGQDMTFFFEDFSEDVVKKMVENSDKQWARNGLGALELRLQEVLKNWTLGTSDDIPAGRQLMPLPESYQDRFMALAEIYPNLRKILKKHPNDGTIEEINQQTGNPINEPAMRTDAGGAEIRANPNFADAFAVENEDGTVSYPESVKKQVLDIANNADQQPAYVHLVHEQARDVNGQKTPEAARNAFNGTLRNKEILGDGTYKFRTVRDNRTQYVMPDIVQVDEIQDNLSYFANDKERINALELAIPSLAVRSAYASAQVSANSGPAALYESVTGNTDYADLESRMRNANRIREIDSELQVLLGPLEGEVGLPNQITLLKNGAQYLLGNVMPTLLGEVEGGEGGALNVQQLNSALQNEFDSIFKMDNEADQVAALVRLNTKMQAYAYASMMDPNGRLSDQDRQQAEVGTGSTGITATKETVLAVSARLASAADRQIATINGYRSNNARKVVATHLYTTQIAGGMPTTVVEFLGRRALAQQDQQTSAQATQEELNTNLSIINESLGITGKGTAADDSDEEL